MRAGPHYFSQDDIERWRKQLTEAAACGDNEIAHFDADSVIVEIVRSISPEFADLWESTPKWYA